MTYFGMNGEQNLFGFAARGLHSVYVTCGAESN